MGFKLLPCFTAPFFYLILILSALAYGQLDYSFYDKSCSNLPMIVRFGVWEAFKNDTRIAASLLRLHFHDCFVNVIFLLTELHSPVIRDVFFFEPSQLLGSKGCDGSVLLDDTKHFKGEKNALPNRNSVRGFEVIDNIKADVERACPLTVSCTDILTLAAREAVYLSGGPYWLVSLGRRDGLTASQKAANEQLPSPLEPLQNITTKFTANGLDLKDVVVLSGAHTIGYAQCFTFKRRLYNFKGSGKPDPTLDFSLLSSMRSTCPNVDGSNSKLAPLDSQTTYRFDNSFYQNLVRNTGLLESDQALAVDPNTAVMVISYSMDPFLFSKDFAESMVKLGNIGVLTGQAGEIRKKCGSVN